MCRRCIKRNINRHATTQSWLKWGKLPKTQRVLNDLYRTRLSRCQPWEYINECGNWDWGRAIPFLGMHKWYFRCSAYTHNTSPVWVLGGGFEGWARCVMASSPAYYERKEVHDGYQGSNMQYGDYGYAVLEVTDVLYFHMTLNQCNCTCEPYLQEVLV